jgi:hypothetical protein
VGRAAHAVAVPAPIKVALVTNGLNALDEADIQAYLNADPRIANVTLYSAETVGVPSLAALQSSADATLFITDSIGHDSGLDVSLGNLLADFNDAGGGVVLTVFSWNPPGAIGGGGRIFSGGYSPFSSFPGQSGGGLLSLLTSDVNHPILDNVNSFRAEFDNLSPTLDAGATVIARYTNGRPLVALNADQDVVALNFFPSPGTSRNSQFLTGDYANLVNNALYFSAQIPEPASLSLAAAGLAALGLFRRNAALCSRPFA